MKLLINGRHTQSLRRSKMQSETNCENEESSSSSLQPIETSDGKDGWRYKTATLCVYSLGYAWLGHPAATFVANGLLGLTFQIPGIPAETQYAIVTTLLGLAGIKAHDLRFGTRR